MTNHACVATLAGLLLVAPLGCEGEQTGSEAVWSTKNESISSRELNRPSLALAGAMPLKGETALRDAAIELLLQAIDAEYAMLRANAIEALHAEPAVLSPALRKCLLDENYAVRFIATMSVGQLGIAEFASLVESTGRDESMSVQAAGLFARKRLDAATDISALAEFLLQDDPEIRGNTAMILGELGNPSAASLLKLAVRRPLSRTEPARRRIVDLQIAEAMVRLGKESELEVIRAALFAPAEQGEIVALACQMSGRLGDRQTLANLLDMALREGARGQSAEVRLAATEAIGRIEPSRMPVEVARDYTTSDLPHLRAQAAMTLGVSRDPDVLEDLSILLSDADPVVQVAAAGAILRITGSLGAR